MFANRVAAAACRGYGGIGVQRHCIAPSSSAAARRGARFVSTAVAAPAAGFQKPRLVVLGTGWGAFSLLHDIDRRLFDVHVVSPRNHMVFTPLLASTAVGTLEFRSIAEPVKASYPHIQYTQALCTGIDVDTKTVSVDADIPLAHDNEATTHVHRTVPYDVLAVAIGARNNTFGIPGVEENMSFLKELADARHIRKSIARNVEAACLPGMTEEEQRRLLSFVIVGGGPTGVEFSAELHDFVVEDLAKLYPSVVPKLSITIIEGNQILGAFDQSLREYTEAKFRRDSITIRTGANVVSVKPGLVTLSDGTSLPFGLGVWNTGIGPRPLIASLSRDKFWCDRWGHLRTTGALNCLQPPPSQASGASVQSGVGAGAPTPAPAAGSGAALAAPIIPGMFALGDCASVEGEHFAATAQVAEQQGAWLAQHLNKAASTAASAAAAASVPYSAAALQAELTRAATQDSTRFEYNHRGSLAFIGTFSAVNDFTKVKPKTPLYGAKIRGALAWFVWRSAYLTKLGSWRNRMQVPLDWSRTLLFGRDTTQF